MNTYFVIIQDTLEVFKLGQYESILQAEKDSDTIEHITHGYAHIIVKRENLPTIARKLQTAFSK